MTDPQPELESQIAFLEDTVAELDRALASQQQRFWNSKASFASCMKR